jgi:hypothetical protein
MDTKLIEATEKVLEGFKAIIALTEQARLEEVSSYDVVAGGLIRMGIDLNDSRIASNFCPTGQLVEELLGDDGLWYTGWHVDNSAAGVTLSLYERRGEGKVVLTLPGVLADLEKAWQGSFMHDYLSPEVAAKAGVVR